MFVLLASCWWWMLFEDMTSAVEAGEARETLWCGGVEVDMDWSEGDDCCWGRLFGDRLLMNSSSILLLLVLIDLYHLLELVHRLHRRRRRR